MIQYLEEKLYEKTKDKQSSILYAQWTYDKKIIPTALQLISNIFPHYSIHDESHSITILNNVLRIFGKNNIDNLSAIDIWLILEASYNHDIGMVISGEDINSAIVSVEFLTFFKDLQKDPSNGLYEFAMMFDIENDHLKYKNNFLDLKAHDGIKFILAEFFRRSHSDRSKEIINDPYSKLSLASPRGSVIPKRIFQILGDICSHHTKSFSEVMQLPFSAVGIDTEDAHPRFIACLLRIGDLLDLDNNRFSEVMLRTLTKIPVETLLHKNKHLSIESFRADREKIEIMAKCIDYDTATLTQHWFNYLNSEISNQMINWNDIVPDKELGYLPTIGNLKVELLNYEFIDGKDKPKFTVDTNKALSLLQGAGLYEGAFQAIREILQNAVDATLLKIWFEYKDQLKFNNPQSKDLLEIAKKHPISISITDKGINGDWKIWQIEIKDKGTGISSEDLKFLMNTGSSSKNKYRTSIIDSMPYWMKPSGTFGIGFQSIFMLTDIVTIKTKSFFNEEFQIIELNSPSSTKQGDILIQKQKTDHRVKPGSEIIFEYQTKAIPNRYSIKHDHENATKIARNFDPFSHDSLDVECGQIIDEILLFSYKSSIPIELFLNDQKIQTTFNEDVKFKYFSPKTELELNIYMKPTMYQHRSKLNIYFKNQPVESNLSLDFLSLEVNIHKEKASKALTLNRNKIKPDFQESLYNQIVNTVFDFMTNQFESICQNDEEKQVGSMFLHYYGNAPEFAKYNISSFSHWENFKIKLHPDNNEMEIKSLLESIDTLVIKYISTDFEPISVDDQFSLNDKELTIQLRGHYPRYDYTKFFMYKAKDFFKSISEYTYEKNSAYIKLIKTNIEKELFDLTKIIEIFSIQYNHSPRFYTSARILIPCAKEFNNLRIKDNAYAPYLSHASIFNFASILPIPTMVSPYILIDTEDNKREWEKSITENLIKWVFDNRYDNKTTFEEIENTYNQFVSQINIEQIKASIEI